MFDAQERTPEQARERVMSGEAWEAFCDHLKLARWVLERPGAPDDERSRAEGYRYLTRMLRAGLQTFMEHLDPAAPALQRTVHETVKMGADNPDNLYLNACISGAYRYRLFGTRGTVGYLGFGTQIGHYGKGLGMPPSGYLEACDMHVADDGTFEIVVSVDDPGPGVNWLPMVPESGTLIVRQTFGDRDAEEPADVHIERIDAPSQPAHASAVLIDEGLAQAARLVTGASALFAGWAEDFAEHTNRLPRFDPATSEQFGGDPNIAYYHSYWRLQPDEALVIDAMPPACDFWNFQVNNHWMESLDYRFHRIHVNSSTAVLRDDGSVRVVVAHRDPGVPNWLTTDGLTQGTMCWRWVRAASHPEPSCRVIPLADVTP